MATPHFYINSPPFFQVYLPFFTKNFVPPAKWLNFWKVLPPPPPPPFLLWGGRGSEDIEFPGTSKKRIECRNYRVQQKNKWNFQRWSRKNPMGLLFWSLKFQLVWHNFVEFPGIKLHSVRIFQGKNNKSKTIETLTEFRKKIHK